MQADKGQALAKEIGGAFVKCDVTQEADAQAAVAQAVSMGKLMGLVNCAGIAIGVKTVGKDGPHPLALVRQGDQHQPGRQLQHDPPRRRGDVQERARADGERGVLINTASVAAYDGQIGQAAYSASKGGIAGMTLPIARDLARNGIRCMTIAPGIFGTPMMFGMPKEVQDALAASVPFPAAWARRPTTPSWSSTSSRTTCSTAR